MGDETSWLTVHGNRHIGNRGYGGGHGPDAGAVDHSIDTARVHEEFLATSRSFLALDAEQDQD